MTQWLIICGAVVGGLLLLQCALLGCCCWRRRAAGGRTAGLWRRRRTKSRDSDLDISPGERPGWPTDRPTCFSVA